MANGKRLILTGAAAAAQMQADADTQIEAQRVARATERSVSSLLTAIGDNLAGHEDAILAGALYALVKFTFVRCWSDKRPRISTQLLERWAPMMMAGVVAAVKDEADV